MICLRTLRLSRRKYISSVAQSQKGNSNSLRIISKISAAGSEVKDYEALFGSEFKVKEVVAGIDYEYRNGKKFKLVKPEVRNEVLESFANLRLQLLSDTVYAFAVGVCLFWAFGGVKDVYSYGVGGVLGIIYSFLLGRYVADLGNNGKSTGGAGNIRFVPVILLIVLYGKFKEDINILPELAGFFTYKIPPFARMFDSTSESSDT